MGIIEKTVKVKWNQKNRNWYESLGYVFTKTSDEFEIPIKDLIKTSSIKLNCICDNCGKATIKTYQNYNTDLKDDGKIYCIKCSHKLYGGENLRQTLLKKNGISFYDWCVKNLSINEAHDILNRWDTNKNKLNPNEVSYSSGGFNRKGYWFKCLEHPEHESELKDICSFTTSHGSLACNKCKSIATTNPEFIKYFENIEDAYKYTIGSMTKVNIKCPECGFVKLMTINNLTRQGLSCNKCSDKVPYPEKFMFNLLEQIGVEFIVQLSKSTFKWCNKYRYDFYLPKNNIIIEVHGLQHYEDVTGWNQNTKSLLDEQENDFIKMNLALENGILSNKYIVVDARYSDLEYIKNSILNSELIKYYNLDNINWNKCSEYALSSIVKQVCDIWNGGINSTSKIAKLINRGQTTVENYLKKGNEIGWCDYSPNFKKKIICLTTNEIFNCVNDACRKYKLHSSNLSVCLNGKTNSCGKLNNEKMKWMFFDRYTEYYGEGII